MAAAGWRELRTATDDGAPWASAVEVAIVAEELSRGLADTAFLGPTLAAELRRLAGAPAAAAPETVALLPDLSGPAVAAAGGALPPGAVAIDAAGAASALVLVADGQTTRRQRQPRQLTLGSVELGGPGVPVDLTRPAVALDSSSGVLPLAGEGQPRRSAPRA